MSLADRSWHCVCLREDSLDVRVARPISAGSFVETMLQSKAGAKRVFAQGQLSSEGAPLRRNAPLVAGDIVTLSFNERSGKLPETAALPDVLYQDPILLAVDKPAGLLVHGDGSGTDTLTAQVAHLLAEQGKRGMPQAVQRLDEHTTGLVLFSLTEEFQPVLDAQVAGHDMHKQYLAVIEGRIPESEGWLELDGPIARDRHDARRMRVGRSGKPALTRVKTRAYCKGRSLLQVELLTGRKHQIRVHLAHAGHPIVGDQLYGGARHADGLMLHAWREQLVHPVTGETLELCAPAPQRFVALFPQLETLHQ